MESNCVECERSSSFATCLVHSFVLVGWKQAPYEDTVGLGGDWYLSVQEL